MGQLTPEQRKKKFEEISLAMVKMKIDRLGKNYEVIARNFQTRRSLRFHVNEAISALMDFQRTLDDDPSTWPEEDDDADEFDDDIGEPGLL